jgi:cell division control protein 6
LDNGLDLVVTKDHPLLTSDLQWKKAEELKNGVDLMVGFEFQNPSKIEIPLALARLLGCIISDGSINQKKKHTKDGRGCWYYSDRQRLRYTNNDSVLLNLVRNDILELFFNCTPSIRREQKNRKTMHVEVISHKICDFLYFSGIPKGKKSYLVRVPKIILKCSQKVQAEFLKALFSGDGTVSKNTFMIEYYSNSKALLQDISLILHQLGIQSKIRYKKSKCNGKLFDSYRLYISRVDNLTRFYELIGFYHPGKQMRLKEMLETKYLLKRNYKRDSCISKIIQISETYEDTVYDLTVPKNHNFISNGMISHNTGKTCSVKKVMNEFNLVESSNSVMMYLNCRIYNSLYRILQKMLKQFVPELDKSGFGLPFLYEKLMSEVGKGKQFILILDEIDMVRNIDELVYTLTRVNDEVKNGGITMVGISNKLSFKNSLDPRSRSSLYETELLFPPYTSVQLQHILQNRVDKGFEQNVVESSAVNLAAAITAQECGDARYALKLMLKAGEIAQQSNKTKVNDEDVELARKKVEIDLAAETIALLPDNLKMVLYAISSLTLGGSRYSRLDGMEEGFLFSGEVYEEYVRISNSLHKKPRSARWYKEYLKDLEMLGLTMSTPSSKGVRGHTTLIKLGYPANDINDLLKKSLGLQ